MTKALQLIMILGLAFSMTGCATQMTWEYLVAGPADSPKREFKPSSELYEGRFLGSVEKDVARQYGGETRPQSQRFDHFQFAGPLHGRNRYMQIYIPRDSPRNYAGIIEDTNVPFEGGRTAFLYTGNFADRMPEQDIKAYFLKEHHIPLNAWDQYPVLLQGGAIMPNAGSVRSPVRINGRPYGSRLSLNVSRVKRKRGARIALASLLSVVTVPLDVVTFPIQVVWFFNTAVKHPV